MSLRIIPSRRPSVGAVLLASCVTTAALLVPGASHGQPAAAEAEPAAVGLVVPPVPDGTPAELMAFVKGLLPPKTPPRSRQEMTGYMKGVAAASVQVGDKILAQIKPDDAAYGSAAQLKLEGLAMLGRLGDEQAEKEMVAYATTLATGPDAELAKQAARMLLVSEAQEMFSSGNVAAAPAIIQKVVAMVAADPDDVPTAGFAMQFAGAFEHMPAGDALARTCFESLGPLFAKSTNPQIQKLGDGFAGTLRRLSLPGKPMEIRGTLLDGTPFDPKSLAGKVVLIDFWATWCGPCVAEMPNMLEQYAKYHDKGFEIVGISLDEDRAPLEAFITEKKIPWPILHDPAADGEGNALARFYGITGIPQLILIGRDGNVITLNARGERLGVELAKLFKDAG